MAFVLDFAVSTRQPTLENFLAALILSYGIKARLVRQDGRLRCALEREHPQLQSFLNDLSASLPASCFVGEMTFYEDETVPESVPMPRFDHPTAFGLCPSCQKELFDPHSRRYFDPFISCNHCGGQYPFVTGYPYDREHSLLAGLPLCDACARETETTVWRKHYPLTSCPACGPKLVMHLDGEAVACSTAEERHSTFAAAAVAIAEGKTVRMKSTLGERLFTPVGSARADATVMVTDAKKIDALFVVIADEFNTLLSFEKPLVRLSVRDEQLIAAIGKSVYVKYPDDGFAMLFAYELARHGVDVVAYTEGEGTDGDCVIGHTLPARFQEELYLLVDKSERLIVSAERGIFPDRIEQGSSTLAVANTLVAVGDETAIRIDRMDRFDTAGAARVVALEGQALPFEHPSIKRIGEGEAAMMSVIAEKGWKGQTVVGCHFEEEPLFLYYNGRQIIRAVPPIEFQPDGFLDRLAALREGSDRLTANLDKIDPLLPQRLASMPEGTTMFDAAALILGLPPRGLAAIGAASLEFMGKGGVQVDTHIRDNRFDPDAFLASLASYRLGGVPTPLLAYSIFESFGDYISEIMVQLLKKVKGGELVLTGTTFGNIALYSRMGQKLKGTPFAMNRAYPIGKNNAIIGAFYL